MMEAVSGIDVNCESFPVKCPNCGWCGLLGEARVDVEWSTRAGNEAVRLHICLGCHCLFGVSPLLLCGIEGCHESALLQDLGGRIVSRCEAHSGTSVPIH